MRKTLFAAAAALVLAANGAQAQTWPARPITMIVPFAAGGPTDIVARIVGEHMSRTLGQQIVVENVAGAGGTTGITRGEAGVARRLHHRHGPHGHPRRRAGALPEPALRPGEGLRADRACRRHADPDRHQEGFSGEQPQGVHRLREGERHEAQRGACRRRLGVAHHLHAAAVDHRREIHPRRLSRHRPGAERPRRRAGGFRLRPDRQPGRRRSNRRTSRRSRSRPRSARRRCPTCRRRRRPGCRNTRSRPGTRCSRRRARRRRSRRSSSTRSTRRSPTTARASACSSSAASSRKAPRDGPQALQKLVESEVARWTPVLKAAGVTAQ